MAEPLCPIFLCLAVRSVKNVPWTALYAISGPQKGQFAALKQPYSVLFIGLICDQLKEPQYRELRRELLVQQAPLAKWINPRYIHTAASCSETFIVWAKLQPNFIKTYHQKQNPNAVLLAQQTVFHSHWSEVYEDYDVYVLVKTSWLYRARYR